MRTKKRCYALQELCHKLNGGEEYMIIYGTKQTMERYGIPQIKVIQDLKQKEKATNIFDAEQGDRMLEWGAKVFYFERRKCIQVCHFASKITFVFLDFKKKEIPTLYALIARCMFALYEDKPDMQKLLNRLWEDHGGTYFGKLTDRKVISTMNYFQSAYIEFSGLLYDWIEEAGASDMIKINKIINEDHIVSEKINGKTDYYCPIKKFEELLKEYYADATL